MPTVCVFPGFSPSGPPKEKSVPILQDCSASGDEEKSASDCFESIVEGPSEIEPAAGKKPRKFKKVIGQIRTCCLGCFCIGPNAVNGGLRKDVQVFATPPSSMDCSSSDDGGVSDAKHKDIISDEEFYSAQSDLEELFEQGNIQSGGLTLVQMKVLDCWAPAIIPPAAMSTSLSLVLALPESIGAGGDWKKSIAESSPVPGQADRVVGASFLVQRVRNKLVDIQINESAEEFTLVFKVPVAGMAPWVESYKKDGSLVEIKNRRDYRSGRACGQAMALDNGVVLIRVWNLGSSPEVMWEESFDFSTENKLKIDHRVFTLDGKKQGRQTSIGYRKNMM